MADQPARLAQASILIPPAAHPLEDLAARELQRYLWLLTDHLPPLRTEWPDHGPVLAVGRAAVGAAERVGRSLDLSTLGEQGLLLQTLWEGNRPIVLIVGGSPVAIQWAAYAFLETLGCGFYLGGDALPARRPDLPVPQVDRVEQPVFAVRGTLPWYNFLNSPTVWNLADHRRFADQLAKQRANFVGFHSYDYEPWAGYPDERGRYRAAAPLCTSGSHDHIWGAVPTPTSEYAFGTDRLYARDLFGADCALDYPTPPDGIAQQQAMLAQALTYYRARGIRTCVGFEVKGDPDLPVNQAALRARLTHLVRQYPLDYLWIWQEEGRGGAGVLRPLADLIPAADQNLAQHFAYLEDPWRVAEGVRICRYARLAHQILQEIAPQVRLIVSGWGGDRWMRFTDFYEGLDKTLPRDIVFAALDNIDPTYEPNVSAVYGRLSPDRERWPIPWFESDGGGTRRDQWGPQPNVFAFAPLLADARAKGCQGILGIHWRTRAVEEVAAFTFRWAWEPDLTPEAFFRRFSAACYGPELAEPMARIHIQLERLGPRWTGAMGQVECAPFTWFSTTGHLLPEEEAVPPFRAGRYPRPANLAALEQIDRELATVEQALAAGGRRHLERVQYLRRTLHWLVQYDRAALQLYPEGPVEKHLREAEALLARGEVAGARDQARQAVEIMRRAGLRQAVQTLAENVTNQGELGVLATVNGKAIAAYKALLRRAERILGEPLQEEILAPGEWPATLHLWVLVTPDLVLPGESLRLLVRAAGPAPLRQVSLLHRPLAGDGEWTACPLHPVRRAVYAADLIVPPAGLAYAVMAEDEAGRVAHAPVGWPDLVYTTVPWPGGTAPATG